MKIGRELINKEPRRRSVAERECGQLPSHTVKAMPIAEFAKRTEISDSSERRKTK